MLNISAFFLRQELVRRGYEVITFDDRDLLLVKKGDKKLYTHAAKVLLDSSGYMVCKNKYLSKQLLAKYNIPTPKGFLIRRDTVEKVSELSKPFVLKPLRESGGKDIQVGMTSASDVEKYFERHPHYDEVLADEMLEGEDVRILIVQGKFFAACQRQPAQVRGDGVHTIKELVTLENNRRKVLFEKQLSEELFLTNLEYIVFDDESQSTLRQQGLSEEYVPTSQEVVRVRQNANVSTGGIAVDVTDKIGESIRHNCERLAFDH